MLHDRIYPFFERRTVEDLHAERVCPAKMRRLSGRRHAEVELDAQPLSVRELRVELFRREARREVPGGYVVWMIPVMSDRKRALRPRSEDGFRRV